MAQSPVRYWTTLFLLVASPALAANVTIKVTDPKGAPVASAEIDLGFGGPKVTTDKDGQATVVVEDDRIDKPATIVVTYRDPVTQRMRSERKTVTLKPTISLNLLQFEFEPARRFGCRMFGGAFQLGGGPGTRSVNGAPLTSVSLAAATSVNGGPPVSSSSDLNATEIAAKNDQERKEVGLTAPIVIGLRQPLQPNQRVGPCDAPGALMLPSFFVNFGRVNVLFDSINQTPSLSQSFSGSGTTLTFGGDFTFVPDQSDWLIGIGFEHFRTSEVAVDRSRPVSDFFPTGSQTISDDVRYQARANTIRGTVGYITSRFVPYGGLGVTRYSGDLNLDSSVSVRSSPPGATGGSQVQFDQSIRNSFGRTSVHAIAGVAIPLTRQIGVMADARVTGSDIDVFVRALLMR
jgi:hypothetical protein